MEKDGDIWSEAGKSSVVTLQELKLRVDISGVSHCSDLTIIFQLAEIKP